MGLGCIWQGFLIHSDWIKVAHLILLRWNCKPSDNFASGIIYIYIYGNVHDMEKDYIFRSHNKNYEHFQHLQTEL